MANITVTGLSVSVFSMSKKGIKVILVGSKDDVHAGTRDVNDILKSLEIHSVAQESAPISLTLLNSYHNATDVSNYEFIVSSFTVRPDVLKISLIANEDTAKEETLSLISKSLSIHLEQETEIQMILSGDI